MRTVLVAKGKMNTGKTTAVCKLKDFLLNSGATVVKKYNAVSKKDINMIVDYKGIRIGISSAGDPGLDQKDILTVFIQMNCSIVICACRTRRATKDAITECMKDDKIIFFDPEGDGFISYNAMQTALTSAIESYTI